MTRNYKNLHWIGCHQRTQIEIHPFFLSSGLLHYPMIGSKRPNSQGSLHLTMACNPLFLFPASLSLKTSVVLHQYKDVQSGPSAPTKPQFEIHQTQVRRPSNAHITPIRYPLTLWHPPSSDLNINLTLNASSKSPAPSESG